MMDSPKCLNCGSLKLEINEQIEAFEMMSAHSRLCTPDILMDNLRTILDKNDLVTASSIPPIPVKPSNSENSTSSTVPLQNDLEDEVSPSSSETDNSTDSSWSKGSLTLTDPDLEPPFDEDDSNSDTKKIKTKTRRRRTKSSTKVGRKKSCTNRSQEGTDEDEEGTFVCKICARVFPKRQKLRNHMNVHTKEVGPVRTKVEGERPWACNLCPSRFLQRVHLFQHLRRHTGERPYQCQKCPANFIQKSSLDNHMRKH